jgi:hypothetical protein
MECGLKMSLISGLQSFCPPAKQCLTVFTRHREQKGTKTKKRKQYSKDFLSSRNKSCPVEYSSYLGLFLFFIAIN